MYLGFETSGKIVFIFKSTEICHVRERLICQREQGFGFFNSRMEDSCLGLTPKSDL